MGSANARDGRKPTRTQRLSCMRITLAAMGKLKAASPEAQLISKYQKQLSWKLDIKELEAKKSLSGAALKTAEAALLLSVTQDCHQRLALDERGQNLGSEAFARHIEDWQTQGCSHLGILIGGADGLDVSVRQQCALTLSFGKLTWPHMLARAMLAEQLYRAESILRGHPYHRA